MTTTTPLALAGASAAAPAAAESASDGSWLSAIVDWCVHLMDWMGPAGAGLAIAIENLFPPIPSEAILPLAGFAASRGSFTIAEAIVWTTLGSLVGALILYGIGAKVGAVRLRRLADRLPLMDGEDVDRTVAWFQKHGDKAVLFGRMLPIFRSLISIPAGVVRMPLWRFMLLTVIGSGIWNSVFVMAGFFLGEAWPIVEQYTDVAQVIVIVAVVAAVAWFVLARVRRILIRRREASTDASA